MVEITDHCDELRKRESSKVNCIENREPSYRNQLPWHHRSPNEALEIVYGGNTVRQIICGKVVARARRGHFLLDAAPKIRLLSDALQLPLNDCSTISNDTHLVRSWRLYPPRMLCWKHIQRQMGHRKKNLTVYYNIKAAPSDDIYFCFYFCNEVVYPTD